MFVVSCLLVFLNAMCATANFVHGTRTIDYVIGVLNIIAAIGLTVNTYYHEENR